MNFGKKFLNWSVSMTLNVLKLQLNIDCTTTKMMAQSQDITK